MTLGIPTNAEGLPIGAILLFSFVLGIIHGATPDEHTWPITFSYSIGSYSTRGGYRSGLAFSLSFTLQRAIASELAFLGLAAFLTVGIVPAIVYVVVGVSMAAVGYYLLRRANYLHWHGLETATHRLGHWFLKDRPGRADYLGRHDADEPEYGPTNPRLALMHGFIAGWGFGPFALVLYFVLAPQMGSPLLGWVPGLLFGIGTLLLQVLFGTVFGRWISTRRNLGIDGIRKLGRRISGSVLFYGGLAFLAAGLAEIAFPAIGTFSVPTGIPVYNLDQISLGFLLVIGSVGGIGIASALWGMRELRRDAERGTAARGTSASRPELPH